MSHKWTAEWDSNADCLHPGDEEYVRWDWIQHPIYGKMQMPDERTAVAYAKALNEADAHLRGTP